MGLGGVAGTVRKQKHTWIAGLRADALCQEHKGKIVPIEFFSKFSTELLHLDWVSLCGTLCGVDRDEVMLARSLLIGLEEEWRAARPAGFDRWTSRL